MTDRYIRQAEEAEAEARRAATPEERRTYEDVARLWRQLAGRRGPPAPNAPPERSD
jgi:ferric-dicitrate binding protein FerR (iron transport regulator)